MQSCGAGVGNISINSGDLLLSFDDRTSVQRTLSRDDGGEGGDAPSVTAAPNDALSPSVERYSAEDVIKYAFPWWDLPLSSDCFFLP